MSWLHRLLRRDKMEQHLDKELRFHLDQHASDLIARGHDPAEARRLARITIGGPEQVKEQCRDARGTRWLEDLWQDFHYAARTLRQRPGFTAVSVLTLALGIGASTAIFSAVNPILFQPLPYPQASRIQMIWYAGKDGARAGQAFGNFRELVARSRSFDALAVMKPWQPTLTGAAEPERFEGQRVSANYFHALGVTPALGRDFDAADDRLSGPDVVVLSDSLWRRRFGGDPSIVGRQITLNDRLFTVVGVMPRGFENVLAPAAEIWALLQYDQSLPVQSAAWGHHLRMVGRLQAGMGTDQARQELDRIARTPLPEFPRPPWSSMKQGLIVDSLRDDLTRAVKPALLAVIGAVILVLAIACVNVTNLLLARGAQRRGEFAMRAALGAGRMRMIRQLLAESLLLALLSGAVAMFVAQSGVQALVALSPAELPRAKAIGVDSSVFAFALGITTLIGLLVGLIPALYASGPTRQGGFVAHALVRAVSAIVPTRRARILLPPGFLTAQGGNRVIGGHQLARRALVVAEVALALVLLVSAGLLLRSLDRLFAIAPGFDAAHVLTMQVQVSTPRRFPDDDAYHRYFAQALEAARQVPGVASAAFTSQLPLSGDFETFGGNFENDNDPGDNHAAFRYAVTPDYFQTMSIPLRRGRLLDSRDMLPGPARPVLINEAFARQKFPRQDPIGQRLRFGGSDNRPWDVIVGVVGDVKQASLAVTQSNAFYVTTAQWLWADNPLWLVVRTRGDAASLAPAIRSAIWSIDKDQPIVRVNTMENLLTASAAERRFAMIIFEAFALVALLLAATGIYGVLSGSVTERTREIGLRAALGATRGDIVGLVIRQAMTLTGLGITIGLAGAVAASGALVTLLFGVSRLDPLTYLGVVALLAGVSAIACWVPAWRAARVDPSITLRAE
jgi:putative ABC transport system permease protein